MSEEKIVTTETTAEEKAPIPEELGGLSEEVAREVMEQAGVENKETESEETHAEQDSENKPVESVIEPVKQSIPYARFKEVNDKKNDIEQQLEAYKAKFGDINAPAPQPVAVQPVTPKEEKPKEEQIAPPMPGLTKDAMDKINAEVNRQALQLSGLTQDAVDALEYADESDPDVARWRTAKQMAQIGVYRQIAEAVQEQQARQKALVENHKKLVAQYNDFYTKESAEPDFDKIKEYAGTEMFEALDDIRKQALADSYARISANVASPQDVLLVVEHYNQAKKQYRAKNPVKGSAPTNINNKLQAAAAHPRSEQITGTTTADGETISTENLEELLRTHSVRDLPQKYRDMLGLPPIVE